MRSRYTAFALGDADYLISTHAQSAGPEERAALEAQFAAYRWVGMKVESTSEGGRSDLEGEVSFVARFVHQGQPGVLRERSRFRREAGRWMYVDGVTPSSLPLAVQEHPGRNEPCACGSGQKFKRCCGR